MSEEALVNFHKVADRQGPGSEEETLQAFALTGLGQEDFVRVADIGCGTGGQTISLARQVNGHFKAVDLRPGFLAELNRRTKQLGLQDRIETIAASMDDLPFEEEELDLIWSEGAIYSMGFTAGIKNWEKYLKPGGCLVVSEITWITHSRPAEIEAFWNTAYPEIDYASRKINVLEENGYILQGYFTLSEDSWRENYYQPMEDRFATFLEDHNHAPETQQLVAEYQEEIRQYEQFKDFYNYAFYVAKKG